MSVSHPFILRPIATTLLTAAIVLAGVLGYRALPVASLPQVEFPTIQVMTTLPGASPDTMANLVTAPLERQLGQIPSLEVMTSSSSLGISQITLQFHLGRDIDAAGQDVQSAINAAAATLPRNLPYPPTFAKVNPADAPIMTLALTSSTHPLRTLSDLADTLVGQRLASVSGVGRVAVEGGIKPAVRIQVDLSRLAAYGLSMADLRTAIVAANVAGPKGSLDGAAQTYTITSNDQITSAEQYRTVVVAWRNGAPVYLTDVAAVTDGLENTKVGGWYKGRTAVIINIQRQPGANVIETVDRIVRELPRLQRSMPEGVELLVVHDRTGTIRASVHDVQFTLVLAVVLVVLVVLLFLKSVSATVIAGLGLPVSIVATFAVMWLWGFSLDNLSLMALTIGTGFIVDDAIVMIENIVRHMEDGEDPFTAAIKGAAEIGFTVISLTVSLLAVFIPLLFMTGLVGRMFREFALTLSVAVVVSAIISLTLIPMLCSRLLRQSKAHGKASDNRRPGLLDRINNWIVDAYMASLKLVVAREITTLVVFFITVGLTLWFFIYTPKGFIPLQDTGQIVAAYEAAPATSFEQMQKLQAGLTKSIERDPDVASVISILGVSNLNLTPNVGHLKITLRPREKRNATVIQVIDRLSQAVTNVAGLNVTFRPVQEVQIATRQSRAIYQYTLSGPNGSEVSLWGRRLVDKLRQNPRLRDVGSDEQPGGLRAFIRVDRAMAARLGVSMAQVSDALNDAFGQRQISTIYAQSNQYRVVLEASPRYNREPSSLEHVYVPSSNGTQVPISAFAKIVRTTGPLTILRQDQFPAVTVSYNLAPGTSLSDAIVAIQKASREIGVPPNLTGNYAGEAAEFTRALEGQPWLLLAAIVCIYLVLGILYESVIHPLTILTTLPSAGIGAMLALWLTGLDLSVVALIGIVLLMGIVKKNAIMMIDFALDAERNHGMSPRDAILEACRLRFRPIMMTTLAALLGALPLAIESGTGSELRNPLGVSIIGGLLISQLLTLYSTPVIYLVMERLRARIAGGPIDVSLPRHPARPGAAPGDALRPAE
ncbi:MAG: efflux RND transporter permease subunit [Hyphomicrobiaceae bacterium]|nr:efflux RND transporter permease subunit [Hyphomicrobiaceae bacterium]